MGNDWQGKGMQGSTVLRPWMQRKSSQSTMAMQVLAFLKDQNICGSGCCFYHLSLATLQQCIRNMSNKPCMKHFKPNQQLLDDDEGLSDDELGASDHRLSSRIGDW